uniref:DNA damage inducible transcript 3 n=1 Tax=Anser brachyrhynchus TaxID=132585 RepID=A0A8B9BL27_9AVES
MAAEGLPVAGSAGGLPGWELEAWYQDLQEVLAAGEVCRGAVPESCELDAALTAELQELLGPHSAAGTEAVQPPDHAFCSSSPTQLGTEDEQVGHKAKRKRGSGVTANKALAKNREQSNEQRVLELTARNEQLREEIRRLSAEVENTRTALINRIVNLRRT